MRQVGNTFGQAAGSGGDPRSFAKMPGGLGPLGFSNYLLYWLGFVGSNAGRWIELTGSLWLVSQLTSSPLAVGGLGLARALPALALSPIAGVVADRVDQRRLLFVTQAISLGLSLALAMSVLSGMVDVWQIYLQLAVQSCVQPFDLAARQTMFPRLVPRSELANAVTLTVAAARLSKSIGPAVGGLAIAASGTAAPYLLNAASFLFLMLALVAMRGVPPRPMRTAARFWDDLREGFREVRRTPLIKSIFQLELVFGVLQTNPAMITIVARNILDVGPTGLGLLLSAPALGSVLGVIGVIAIGGIRRAGRFAVISVAVYAALMFVVGISASFVLTLLALFATGVVDVCVSVVRQGIVQLTAPNAMRGRVMSNMAVVSSVSHLSQVQSGFLAAVLGAPQAVMASALVLVTLNGIIASRNPTLWTFEQAPVRPGQEVSLDAE